jgi:hypothetical protein
MCSWPLWADDMRVRVVTDGVFFFPQWRGWFRWNFFSKCDAGQEYCTDVERFALFDEALQFAQRQARKHDPKFIVVWESHPT